MVGANNCLVSINTILRRIDATIRFYEYYRIVVILPVLFERRFVVYKVSLGSVYIG